MVMLRGLFPFLSWFHEYKFSTFRADLIAGVTVALVLIPQSMAYAQLAGLPAYYGLYAAFLPPIVAAAFGSSRQLMTGPVAIVSLMTATALEPLATAGSEAYIGYALLLAFLVGLFQLLLGLLRLGMLVNFLSHPVVNGFINAGAIIIASSQLSKFFGVSVDKGEHQYETVWNVLVAAREFTHWGAFGLGILALAIMWGLKQWNPKIPNVLAAVAVSIILSWAIGFEQNHVADVTSIDSSIVEMQIDEFNSILGQVKKVSEVRAEISPRSSGTGRDDSERSEVCVSCHDRVTREGAYAERSRVCLSCHSWLEVGHVDQDRSTALIHRRHDVDLLGFELEHLREQTSVLRAELRALQFRAIQLDEGELRFYFKDDLPSDRPSDGRIWRLEVGTQQLDKAALMLTGGGAVVGSIPQGLPRLAVPKLDFGIILNLMSMVVTISLLGFMEAISVAKAMATKTGQRLDYNQELIGQGLANIVGSAGQSYPVSGSFSRSAVNLQAGAMTGMSSVFCTAVVIIALLFLTPTLYHLPQSVLAAIIMMAVIGLVNVRGFIHCWRAQKYDGAISIITFISTLAFAPHVDRGIMIGVLLSLALYLLRHMKPEITMLARYEDATFRNTMRFSLAQCRHIAIIRFPSSLWFANASHLEEKILERIAGMPELKHILIVGNGINELDASGEEMLSNTVDRLREAGYDLSLSGLNDSVLDVMRRTGLYEKIGDDHYFQNASLAIDWIDESAHVGSQEGECPLQRVKRRALRTSERAELPASPPEHETEQESHGEERGGK